MSTGMEVWKGFRIFFAVIISIILFGTCLVYAGMYTAKTVVNDKTTIRAVVDTGVLKDVVASQFNDKTFTVDGISISLNDLFDTLMQQPVFSDYVTDYGFAVVNVILGNEAQTPALSATDKQTLTNALYDKLYADIQTKFGTLLKMLPKAQLTVLQQQIKSQISLQLDTAISKIPTAQDTAKNLQSNYKSLANIHFVLNMVRSSLFAIILFALAVITALLIFHPYKWMLYTAIPLLAAGFVTLLMGFGLSSVFLSTLTGVPEIAQTIFGAVKDTISAGLTHIGGALVLAGIILFAARFIFGWLTKKINPKPALQPATK